VALNSASRIVVIGGTSGIGLAVARAAADAGAQVIIGSRSAASVERALAQIPAAAGQAVDVTSPESLKAFFAGTGEFDHLAYTAGDALVPCAIKDYTPGQARRFFDVRLFRALDTVRAALTALRPAGSITLTAGIAAYRGGAGALLGAAASGAVISAARSLASELAPLRVNAVVPGIVRTPLWSAMTQDEQDSLFTSAGSKTLLGRVAEPEDAAKAFLHLIDQDHVTGTASLVDGGGLLA
jgi:NAD(P)-dependent dehydrogenase (short-subunit alcohol dehydrogenase family)